MANVQYKKVVASAVAGALFVYTLANSMVAFSLEAAQSPQATSATQANALTVADVKNRLKGLVDQGKTAEEAMQSVFATAKSTEEQATMLQAATEFFPGQEQLVSDTATGKGFDSTVIASNVTVPTGTGNANGSGSNGDNSAQINANNGNGGGSTLKAQPTSPTNTSV